MKHWLREPVHMSRLTLFAITFFLGVVAAAGVIAGAAALRHAAAERNRAIAAERLTTGDVERIAHRIFAIESPTREQLLERILLALRACAHDPRCRRALEGATRRSSTSTGDSSAAAATRRVAPVTGGGSPTPTTRRRRPDGTRRGDRRDASPPPGSSDRSQPPEGATPPALVDVQLPPAFPFRPQLCLPPLLDVDC